MAGGPAFDTDETAGVPLLHVLPLLILFALAACGPAAPERKWQQSAHGSMSAAWVSGRRARLHRIAETRRQSLAVQGW